VSAIGVAQAARGVVVFGEQERRVGAVDGVLEKQAVHRAQQTARMIAGDSTLAAKIGLQVGHQQSGGDAFAGDVADDQAKPVLAEIEEVEIISSNFAGGMAQAGVFEGFGLGMDLWEQARLHLLGDFHFLGSAAIGFEFLGESAALSFDAERQFVEAGEAK